MIFFIISQMFAWNSSLLAYCVLLLTKFETDFQSFILRDEPRMGCSSDFNQDSLRELVKYNLHISTQELALDTSTICHNLNLSSPYS